MDGAGEKLAVKYGLMQCTNQKQRGKEALRMFGMSFAGCLHTSTYVRLVFYIFPMTKETCKLTFLRSPWIFSKIQGDLKNVSLHF